MQQTLDLWELDRAAREVPLRLLTVLSLHATREILRQRL
jgi:hypothetical protein